MSRRDGTRPSSGAAASHSNRPPRERTRIETSAGGVVFRRETSGVHLLLIRDPYHNWGLPKGHLEDGETPLDAALREVAEETGLVDLEPAAELPTIDWYFRDRGRLVHKFCHFFMIECASGETNPQLDEGISECLWLPVEEAVERVTYDNAREVLRAAGQLLGMN